MLQDGLRAVLDDTPVRQGYLQLSGTWQPSAGLVGRLEGGFRPLGHVGLFGYGQLDRFGPSAGLGARWEF